ncbi:MAG: hypothetical protein JWM58_1167 [Rhizobium sp.]|nr:hypothetical protein [Rhizobium sp.]
MTKLPLSVSYDMRQTFGGDVVSSSVFALPLCRLSVNLRKAAT